MKPSFARTSLWQERKFSSSLRDSFRRTPYLLTLGGLSLVFSAVAYSYSRRFALAPFEESCIYLSFVALLALVMAPGFWTSTHRDFVQRDGRLKFLAMIPLCCCPYLLYAIGTGDFHLSALLKLLAASALFLALYGVTVIKRLNVVNWQDIIAVPLSLGLHFTRWNPRWRGPGSFALDYLEILLFVALLEELFFRGFLQTLLSGTMRNAIAAQVIVSGLFGLFHILHAPFPNWHYVALASLAGWFYGSAFRKTGNLMASTILHAAVDTVWRTWLSAR